MIPPINNNISNTFSAFGFKHNRNDHFFSKPKREPLTLGGQIGIASGSLLGTILPLLIISKYQKNPINKLKYAEKEMIMLSTGSIIGGISGGIITDKNSNPKNKIHEGIFQFFNAGRTHIIIFSRFKFYVLIKPLLKLCALTPLTNNNKIKALTLLAGIFSGMYLASKISNKINKTTGTENERHVKFIDSLANIDVISGALIMAEIPFIKKLGVEKFLPAIYLWTGYQSGKIR